jgi:hypothetical protein
LAFDIFLAEGYAGGDPMGPQSQYVFAELNRKVLIEKNKTKRASPRAFLIT